MIMQPELSLLQSSHLRIVHSHSTFRCKEILPLRSETLWKIEAGAVRSFTWDEMGRTVTLGFWGKGDVVGHPLSRLRPYQIECLTDVRISELSPESADFQPALLSHIWKSEELLQIIHLPSISERLLRLLQWLAYQFGKPVQTGTLINLRLTHQNLADSIGSTRVSITRLLGRLEQQGRISRSQRYLILCL